MGTTTEARREYQRKYYQEHKEKQKEYQRHYNRTHKKSRKTSKPIQQREARQMIYNAHDLMAAHDDRAVWMLDQILSRERLFTM